MKIIKAKHIWHEENVQIVEHKIIHSGEHTLSVKD
jgi:hypothetical protein